MALTPVGRLVVLAENDPATRTPEPRTLFPFFRVTVPVGALVWDTLAATVVGKVAVWPYTDGLLEESTAILVPCVFSNTLTVLLTPFATAKSGVPLPLKSPTTSE